jgi:hypothetical protein
MKPSSRSPRMTSRLSDSTYHQLNLYTLAASAAGVSLLASVQPSEAKIVYTKTHQVIGADGIYPLDLNHNGIIDFLIQEFGAPFSNSGSNRLLVKEAFGNAVEASNAVAAALGNGALIDSRQRFIAGTNYLGEVMVQAGCSIESGCSTQGQWVNVNNRYLGLKFRVNGRTHYGWARLTLDSSEGETVLHAFKGVPDGNQPVGGVVRDDVAMPVWSGLQVATSMGPRPAAGQRVGTTAAERFSRWTRTGTRPYCTPLPEGATACFLTQALSSTSRGTFTVPLLRAATPPAGTPGLAAWSSSSRPNYGPDPERANLRRRVPLHTKLIVCFASHVFPPTLPS